jgi:hypothetical protein
MRNLLLVAVLLAAGSLGACSKCDVPTYGWAAPFVPAVCSSETPRR